MAGLPTVQVLLDDGTGTFPYDISSYAQLVPGYKVKRGRQDELSDVTPGDMTLVLDNTDGRFTLGSTVIASPSPIQVDAKVRIKVTANATVFTRSTTYVQSWPVEWPTGGDEFAIATISGTDVQAKGQRQPLRSVVEEEILVDSPSAYYTLGEPAGATAAADSSGSQASALTMAGSGTDVVFGSATGPSTDGLTAATFAGGKYLSATLGAVPAVLECYFSTSTTPASISPILGTNPGGGMTAIGVYPDGKLHTTAGGDLTSPVVTDGLTHHLVWELGHVYLDGVDIGSPADLPVGSAVTVVAVGGGGGTPFTGTIAHVAAYASALSSARATAHYQAGSTGFAGESGTARVTRLAGYAGLPLGTLDTSLTNVAFTDITDEAVIDAIGDVADAEFGLAFFDGSGNLTFHNRNRAISKLSPDATIDANFLDPGTQFIVDMQGVLNYFSVTAEGTKVTQLVRNTVSELGDGTAAHPKHGRYPGSKSYLVQTDAEALDRGNWTVFTHAQPAARVGSLVVDVLTMTAAQQAAMLGLEPNSWLRVTGLPGQTPGSTTADFIVQGFAEAVNASEWTLTINAANKAVAAPTPWVLGDTTYSVLGSTTRLYV